MRVIVFLMAFIISCNLYGQLGKNKFQIVADEGSDYSSGQTKSSPYSPYITYIKEGYTEYSGKYMYSKSFYFQPDGKCYLYIQLEPLTEINDWVKFLNDNYVKLTESTWKDYEKNVVFRIRKIFDEKYNMVEVSKYYDDK